VEYTASQKRSRQKYVIVPNHQIMNIDISFLKISRFLLLPIAFLFLANTTQAEPVSVPSDVNFLDIFPFHQELLSSNDPSQIFQEGLLEKKKKRKKQDEGKDAPKKENCVNEVNTSESEEGINPVKSYQQLKGILEEVDMMVSGWV
jgi:hypothetical protein